MTTLKDIRNQRGVTQRALAQSCDVSHVFISDVEAGRRPLPRRCIAIIAKTLNVSEDELLRACPPLRINVSDLTIEQRGLVAQYAESLRQEPATPNSSGCE